MAEQSRRTFLRRVSVTGAAASLAAVTPAFLYGTAAAHAAAPTGPGTPAPAPGTAYEILIRMSGTTVDALVRRDARLCLFKAVASEIQNGVPLLWASTAEFSSETRLAWREGPYTACVSEDEIEEGAVFRGSNTFVMDLGEVLRVGEHASGTVMGGGQSGSLTFENASDTQYSVGISQPDPVGHGPVAPPFCSFPLHPEDTDTFTPVNKVALAFTSEPLAKGEVITTAPGPTVLVDMDRANPACLSYDVEEGWRWDGDIATDITDGDFVEALIRTP